MSFGCKELNIVSQSSPTGTQYLQATGAAFALQKDNSKGVLLQGNHTLIASAGLREEYLGKWADDSLKRKTIIKICDLIDGFS